MIFLTPLKVHSTKALLGGILLINIIIEILFKREGFFSAFIGV